MLPTTLTAYWIVTFSVAIWPVVVAICGLEVAIMGGVVVLAVCIVSWLQRYWIRAKADAARLEWRQSARKRGTASLEIRGTSGDLDNVERLMYIARLPDEFRVWIGTGFVPVLTYVTLLLSSVVIVQLAAEPHRIQKALLLAAVVMGIGCVPIVLATWRREVIVLGNGVLSVVRRGGFNRVCRTMLHVELSGADVIVDLFGRIVEVKREGAEVISIELWRLCEADTFVLAVCRAACAV